MNHNNALEVSKDTRSGDTKSALVNSATAKSVLQDCYGSSDIENGNKNATSKPSTLPANIKKLATMERQLSSGSFCSSDAVSDKIGTSRGAFPIWITVSLITFLGAATCAAFLAVGISSANKDKSFQFSQLAQELVHQIEEAWEDYVTAASWIHGQCRRRNFTRSDFRQTYEYLLSSGLVSRQSLFSGKE
jgi:hypothetical protein